MDSPSEKNNCILPDLQPKTLYDIPLNDPLHGLVQNQLASSFNVGSRMSVNDIDAVGETWEETIKNYINQGSWRALAAFSKQRLLLTDRLDVDTLMKLWCYRLFSLIKVNLCQLASSELEKLGDLFRWEFDFEAHPSIFIDRKGSMVPFILQVIWARLPSYLGDKGLSIDRLFFLINKCRETYFRFPDQASLWAERILQTSLIIINYLIELEDFSLATELLQNLINENQTNLSLRHFLVRLHLHGGNLSSAKSAFLEFKKNISETPYEMQYISELKMDESLLMMAQGEWEQAQEILSGFLEIKPDSYSISNNLAVCSLYLCNLPKAVQLFQSIVTSQKSPGYSCHDNSLMETSISNLVTLYELATQNHLERKRALLEQIHTNLGDGFDTLAFKLSGVSQG